MKPLYKHAIIGFLIGFFGMPIWYVIVTVGMAMQGIEPDSLAFHHIPFWLNMLIGGGIGLFVFLSIYHFPKIRRKHTGVYKG